MGTTNYKIINAGLVVIFIGFLFVFNFCFLFFSTSFKLIVFSLKGHLENRIFHP